MNEIIFEEEDPTDLAFLMQQRKKLQKKKTGALTALVIKAKLAKDDQQAQVVLLVFAVGIFVLSLAYYFIQNPPTPHGTVYQPGEVNPALEN